ncbi:hypothetical protein ACP275_04G127600 [Erythranthe tilingii]
MLDQRGGCCIARYAGGGAFDMSNMGQIMLRFRPIAPKPASADGSISGGGTSWPATAENGGLSVKMGRGKRRGRAVKGGASTAARNKRSYTRKKNQSSSPENTDSGGSVSGGGKEIKTLALLPETPSAAESRRFPALWLSLGNGGGGAGAGAEIAADRSGVLENPAEAVGRRAVVVRSWVKVECVTDAAAVGGGYVYGGIGRTDEERVRCLDLDTCPGFVTDGVNVVRWTNAAYRRMAAGGAAEAELDLWVEVVEGAELPVGGSEGFTCRVRVVTCGREKISQTVPCDVWRMGWGGFAWRLDTTAALSLGRL